MWREERTFGGELLQDQFQSLTDHQTSVPLSGRFQFFPGTKQATVVPVDIFGTKIGDIRLAPSRMPQEFKKYPIFLVRCRLQNCLVLFERDPVAVSVADFWPGLPGKNGPQDPLQIQGAIVEDAQLDIR